MYSTSSFAMRKVYRTSLYTVQMNKTHILRGIRALGFLRFNIMVVVTLYLVNSTALAIPYISLHVLAATIFEFPLKRKVKDLIAFD